MRFKDKANRSGGFFRLNIVEEHNGEKKIVGDSGWKPNMITNLGAQYYIIDLMLGSAGSMRVGYAGLGSGGAVLSADTNISNPCATNRNSFTISGATVASRTLRYIGTLQSNVYASTTIGNVGLFSDSATSNASGSMFAGNTFTSSTLATNQAVNLTYDIQFATS